MANRQRENSKRKLTNEIESQHFDSQPIDSRKKKKIPPLQPADIPKWEACNTLQELAVEMNQHYSTVLSEMILNLNNIYKIFELSKKKKWTGKKKIKGETIPVFTDTYYPKFQGLLSLMPHINRVSMSDQKSHLEDEVTALQQKLYSATKQNSDFSEMLRQNDAEITNLRHNLSKTEENLSQSIAEIKKLQNSNVCILQRADENGKKVEEMKHVAAQLHTENDGYKQQIEQMSNHIQQLQYDGGRNKKHSEEMEVKLKQCNKEWERLTNTLHQKEDDIASLHERLTMNNQALSQKDKEYQQALNQQANTKIQLREKDKTIQDISMKLAEEMSHKLSSDESSVENVSIKNRPMNVAEEYQNVCSNHWLDAKGAVDKSVGNDVPEYQRLQLLCSVIQVTEREAKTLPGRMTQLLQAQLYDPVTFIMNQTGQSSVNGEGSFSKKSLPVEFNNMLGDLLRNTADNVDLTSLIQHVNGSLESINNDPSLAHLHGLWTKCKTNPDVVHYVNAVVRIVWKMVMQRPPMEFKFSKKWHGERCQEVFWNSDSVPNPVVVEVYPMVYHGDSMMTKGKVLLLDPHKITHR